MVELANTIKQTSQQPQIVSVVDLLEGARQALARGDQNSAHQYSLEATQQDFGNVEAWLMRARTAFSPQERLFCLSQANRLDPDHPAAKQELYTTMKANLEKSPFLAYLDETDQVYYVSGREYISLAVPKDREIPESYPPKRPEILSRAYRYLGWSFAGLAIAGLGTLIFAPLAMRDAISTFRQPLPKTDRVRARIIILISMLLFAVALFLGWLFLAHFTR